jgi:hypothetical protein
MSFFAKNTIDCGKVESMTDQEDVSCSMRNKITFRSQQFGHRIFIPHNTIGIQYPFLPFSTFDLELLKNQVQRSLQVASYYKQVLIGRDYPGGLTESHFKIRDVYLKK